MATKVICLELSLPWFTTHAMAFIPNPEPSKIKSQWALFTHGYTSHKGDCLNWATRLSEAGVPCMIFDQPGHYLGSFNEANSLEDFKQHSHELFGEAFLRLQGLMEREWEGTLYPQCSAVILGGHSLGAFNAIRALTLPQFKDIQRLAVGIGIGIGQSQATHIFETAFYEKTLNIRRQLVSPALDAKEVFAWLKAEKENMTISNERMHLITGEDDVVVGNSGLDAFMRVLEEHGNAVTFDRPKRLPHHEPGMATAHLYSFLKEQYGWA